MYFVVLPSIVRMALPQPGSPPTAEQYTPPPSETEPNKEQDNISEQPTRRRGKGRLPKTLHTFKCSTCQEVFDSPSALQSHKLSVHGKDKQQQYTCGKCTKTFSSRAQLSKHQRSHSVQRPFQCPQCHKAYKTHSELRNHSRSHTGEKPFVCFDCGKAFMQAICLRIHMTQHSGERPHSCPHCSKSYPTLSKLKVHQRSHTGEKPYFCSECGKSLPTLQCTASIGVITKATGRIFAASAVNRTPS